MPSHLVIIAVCSAAAAFQLWRVPRVWAFLLMFIVLMPKLALAAVPDNPTPIRLDDVVMGAVLGWWVFRRFFSVTFVPDTTARSSPATFFVLLYWSVALACTLLGMAAGSTPPLTGVLHAGRMIQYGLLYYFFYTSIGLDELGDAIRVLRFTLLTVCGLWIVQHWTYTIGGPPAGWATYYPTFSATYDFGGYLMSATVVMYALWSTGASRGPLTTVALLAGLYVTLNSDARAALLGVALTCAFDIVARRRWKTAVAFVALASLAPLLIQSKKMLSLMHAVVAFATTLNLDVVSNAFVTDRSLALRLRNWRLAWDHWLARPLVGDGLGGYLRYTRQYDVPGSIDGWYIRLLADTGVLGLVAFLLLVGALVWMLLRASRHETQPQRRAIVYGAALTVVAAAASAVLVDTFVSYKIMGVFWMIVAIGTRVAAEHAPFVPVVPAHRPKLTVHGLPHPA